jgi:hypothetical protein
MSEFIQRNRGFLKSLSGPLGIVSTVLLVLGVVWAGLKSVGLFSRLGDWQAVCEYWREVPYGILLFIVLGLVGRGMSQLLRYMHDVDYHPQWLLRHGDLLLYAYAVLFSVRVLIDLGAMVASEQAIGRPGWATLSGILFLLYAVAGDLILVGSGQLLKRLMPLIEEVRTLA